MNKKPNAKVVLGKCPKAHKLYGMRIEERDGDWVRTWTFPVDEIHARHEGFDAAAVTGSMRSVDGDKGCPYCGSRSLAVHSTGCGKAFCYQGPGIITCPWCGQTDEYVNTAKVQVGGQSF